VNARQLPVEPALFDLVTRYAEELNAGKVSAKTSLKRTTPIVEFCRTFFVQFFEHELDHEIIGIDQQAKFDATRMRIDLEDQPDSEPTRLLIGWFEELCDIWPDVLGFSYGGSASEFLRFHTSYVPRLLQRTQSWAEVRGYDELVERAKAALAAYEPALKKLKT
jgi:hypothetical protein